MRPYSALCIAGVANASIRTLGSVLPTFTPMATANFDASPSDRHLLEDVSVGLIVLGSAPALDFSSYKEQLILPESVQAISSNSISCCEWECNLTLEIRYHCSTRPLGKCQHSTPDPEPCLQKSCKKGPIAKSHAAPATSRGRHCLAAFAGRGDRRLDEYFRMTVLYRYRTVVRTVAVAFSDSVLYFKGGAVHYSSMTAFTCTEGCFETTLRTTSYGTQLLLT